MSDNELDDFISQLNTNQQTGKGAVKPKELTPQEKQ
jgi:hypothetical protein